MHHANHVPGPDATVPRGHDEDEDTKLVKPSVVDSKGDRLNPPTEYDVQELADLEPLELKDKLNELGKEGWALISTTPYFVFRRMKKGDDEKPRGRVGFGV